MQDRRSFLERQAGRWLPPIALAGAVLIVFGGSLRYFFAQDDFFALARVQGILPSLTGPWRYLSAQAYFDLMGGLAGTNAAAYHGVSLAGHAACAALLHRILRREFAFGAALVASTFFAVHPMLFTLQYSISAVADIFALCLALATLEVGRRTDSWRWAAVPTYAVALLCKESVLLQPLVLLLFLVWDRRPGAGGGARPPETGGPERLGWRRAVHQASNDPLVWVLAICGASYTTYFFAARPMAYSLGDGSAEAYALGAGSHLWWNGLTYLGWTSCFLYPTVQGFTDAVDPRVFPYGFLTLALWAAGAFVPALRRRGWILGGAMFLLYLLPVLPLRNHTYHYYVYGSLIGTAWCVAAAWDALWETARRTPGPSHPRASWKARPAAPGPRAPRRVRPVAAVATGAVIAGLIVNGFAVVRRIETQPFVHPELRAEPVVDRARIARNACTDLMAFEWPARAKVLFWSPEARRLSASRHPEGRASEHETYWEANVRNALADGLAVRVMVPEVREVEFVLDFGPVGDSLYYAIYRVTGELEVRSSADLEALLRRGASSGPERAARDGPG